MIFNSLTNNRLILNGHRILNKNQLLEYFNKKFKSEITNEQAISEILAKHENLEIAIWHGDTFLQQEDGETQERVIALLKSYGKVKITGHNLKS